MILQKALGYKPLSIDFMALCTSSLEAETPRCAYLLETSELIGLCGVWCGKDSEKLAIEHVDFWVFADKLAGETYLSLIKISTRRFSFSCCSVCSGMG